MYVMSLSNLINQSFLLFEKINKKDFLVQGNFLKNKTLNLIIILSKITLHKKRSMLL